MDADQYQVLLDEVRQNFASVVWTHKIQEKQADIYAGRYTNLETANIIIASVISCGLITIFFVDWFAVKICSAILAFVQTSIAAYFKSFDLRGMEQRHRVAANSFIGIRNQLLHIISRIHMKDDLNSISKEYESTLATLEKLYMNAPSTTNQAVKEAEAALNNRKEYTYTDEEIDQFLPPALRGGVS